MDEAYTGSAIENLDDGSGFDGNGSFDLADPTFLEILKDENDGIAVCANFLLGWYRFLTVTD